jgi:uncharacterized protein with HEPN domain
MSAPLRRLMRSMLSKTPNTALRDILHHIDVADRFVAGLDYASFRDDLRTFYAVTRCLEIISEASRRLPEAMKERHPSIAWQDMAGAANVYRHDYEDVAARYVWSTMKQHLPPLRIVIVAEIAALDSGQ